MLSSKVIKRKEKALKAGSQGAGAHGYALPVSSQLPKHPQKHASSPVLGKRQSRSERGKTRSSAAAGTRTQVSEPSASNLIGPAQTPHSGKHHFVLDQSSRSRL